MNSLTFGTILRSVPSVWRSEHSLVDLHVAYAFGWANRLWNKRDAAFILFRANMESAESHGSGNRAKRRAAS